MYQINYSKRFVKQIKKIPQKEQFKILEDIKESSVNPRQFSIKLESTKPAIYRLRIGEYRVFFELDEDLKLMIVTDFLRRTSQTYH